MARKFVQLPENFDTCGVGGKHSTSFFQDFQATKLPDMFCQRKSDIMIEQVHWPKHGVFKGIEKSLAQFNNHTIRNGFENKKGKWLPFLSAPTLLQKPRVFQKKDLDFYIYQ